MEPRCLPPNTSQAKFEDFISRAKQLCGDDNVTIISRSAELINGDYVNPCKAHDMHHLFERDTFVASAVICPRGVPEVQDIVRLCNEFSIPLWPYSAGRNTGYGGTAPRVSGSVAMDLGAQMNKILEVDVDGAFALVEPGVTFLDLHEYLEKHNLREQLWLDVSIVLILDAKMISC
jgi:FAD/FMN-containing dehydrogenase